jgi:hypothetical protein
MIYIVYANKYKFNKLVDFLISLFSHICTFIHLHYIYYTLCIPNHTPLGVQYS